jgi:hypothetical protein
MQTDTLTQIEDRLRQLSPEKLVVVLDFVSYLGDRDSSFGSGYARRIFDDEAALETGYRAMAADEEREREALEWVVAG